MEEIERVGEEGMEEIERDGEEGGYGGDRKGWGGGYGRDRKGWGGGKVWRRWGGLREGMEKIEMDGEEVERNWGKDNNDYAKGECIIRTQISYAWNKRPPSCCRPISCPTPW